MTEASLGGKKVGPNPTDRGKRGVKRSLLVEGKGVPVGVAVDGANRHDSKLVERTLDSIPVRRPKPTRERPQHMCLDKSYDFEFVLKVLAEYNLIPMFVAAGRKPERVACIVASLGGGWSSGC